MVFLVLLLSQYATPQGLGRIYVYAQRETAARSWRPISCDGAVVAKIKRGTFFAINARPGRHVLNDAKGVPVFVDVTAGREVFVRLDWQIEGGEPAAPVLVAVNADVARNEMRFVTYIDPKEALSTLVPKTDPRASPELHFKRRDDLQ